MVRDYDALAGFIAGRRDMPFSWGRSSNDCVSFAAGAVVAQIGCDPLKGLAWKTEAQALRLVAKHGGLAAAVSSRLSSIAPAHAHRGDIAGVPDSTAALGVLLMVIDGEMLVGPCERGIRRLPRSAMTMAWSAVA